MCALAPESAKGGGKDRWDKVAVKLFEADLGEDDVQVRGTVRIDALFFCRPCYLIFQNG